MLHVIANAAFVTGAVISGLLVHIGHVHYWNWRRDHGPHDHH